MHRFTPDGDTMVAVCASPNGPMHVPKSPDYATSSSVLVSPKMV